MRALFAQLRSDALQFWVCLGDSGACNQGRGGSVTSVPALEGRLVRRTLADRFSRIWYRLRSASDGLQPLLTAKRTGASDPTPAAQALLRSWRRKQWKPTFSSRQSRSLLSRRRDANSYQGALSETKAVVHVVLRSAPKGRSTRRPQRCGIP